MKNGYLKVLQRRNPLGRQGTESLRRGGIPPESATDWNDWANFAGYWSQSSPFAKNMRSEKWADAALIEEVRAKNLGRIC